MSDLVNGGQIQSNMVLPAGTNGENPEFGRMIVTDIASWTIGEEWVVYYNSLKQTGRSGSMNVRRDQEYEVVGFLTTSPLSQTGI